MMAALVVLVLGISAPFGGLDGVDGPGLPRTAVNTVDRGAPWNVTVTGVRLLDGEALIKPRNEGDHWLVVLATVEVTADESRGDMYDILRLAGVTGLRDEKPDYVYLIRDDSPVGKLNPGMPEALAFAWAQSPDVALPAEIEVDIIGKTLRADSLTGSIGWFDEAPRSRVTVPVEDRREKKP
jgi:hypothetical protein